MVDEDGDHPLALCLLPRGVRCSLPLRVVYVQLWRSSIIVCSYVLQVVLAFSIFAKLQLVALSVFPTPSRQDGHSYLISRAGAGLAVELAYSATKKRMSTLVDMKLGWYT